MEIQATRIYGRQSGEYAERRAAGIGFGDELSRQLAADVIPEPERSSKTVKGVTWTDEMLGALTGLKNGVTVDTTKTINWNSTGDQSLTKEQAEELQKKYDVNNLSPQDYYDLMSELSHLNVISAEDIHGMYLKTAMLGNGISPVSGGSSSGFGGPSFIGGNLLGAVNEELGNLGDGMNLFLDDEYWKTGLGTGRGDHQSYAAYLTERTASMNKLQQIFNSIKR